MVLKFLHSMFWRRQFFYFWIGLFLLLPTTVFGGGLSWYEQVVAKLAPRIAIITTSDLQSNIYRRQLTDNGGTATIGGMDRIAALSRQVRNETDGALLVSTGDDLMGAFYSVFAGEPEITSMNMAGYDAVAPGNHEFDQGVPVYAAAAARAEFDILAANLTFINTPLAEIIKPCILKNIAGVKIGIFGLVTPTLKKVSNAGKEVEVDSDLVKTAAEMTDLLRVQGANLVVALSHCGIVPDRQIAAKVAGLDLIVSGHSHESLFETVTGPDGKTCVIVQAGAGGGQVGVLKFSFTGTIHNPQWELIPLNEQVGSVTEIKNYVDGYVDKFDQLLEEPVGETLIALDSRKEIIRRQESNLGDLVTNALSDWFHDDDNNPALSMFSSGSIRGNRIYSAGPLSRKDILNILPFGNTIVRVEMTGRQMLAVLEAGASALEIEGDGCAAAERVRSGGFLQLSRAFRVTIDPGRPPFCAHYDGKDVTEIINPGQRVIQVELFQEDSWLMLSPETTYTVYVNSWLAAGGDGHYVFTHLKKFDSTVLAADALTRYIEQHTPINPTTEGRIVIKPDPLQ
jgi:2',3'-cyclic-nucleotide 2'-phosphodiesterase (5'-nucleotidase family)